MRRRRRARRSPLLTYVVDPYSLAARQYLSAVRELSLRLGERLPIEVVCTGDRVRQPISQAYGHLVAGGAAALELRAPFVHAVRRDAFSLDALAAGAGIIALLATEAVPAVTVVEDVVRSFFDRGQDIADPEVSGEIAARRVGDGDAVSLLAASPSALELAREDRAIAAELGDPEGALLVLSARGRLHRLPGPGVSGRDLVRAATSLI